jgi:uncharacterized membrane-anchored protein YjiN (DUF445 family)
MSLELDLQGAVAVLSAIRRANPQLPIQEALNETHQQSELRQAVRDRYDKILDNLDRDDVEAILASLPKTKYQN